MILKELLITNKAGYIKIGSGKSSYFMYAGKAEDMARKLQYIMKETYIDYITVKHKQQYERFKT